MQLNMHDIVDVSFSGLSIVWRRLIEASVKKVD